jgi:hypothetical protein
MIAGKERKHLFAVPLTCIWDGRIRSLPCTVVLVQDGPMPLAYKRLSCICERPWIALDKLKERFLVSKRFKDVRFYLQYDGDFYH